MPSVQTRRFDERPAGADGVGSLLQWASKVFDDRLALASALGDASVVVLDHATSLGLPLRVLFLDTGLHFDETYAHLERVENHFGVSIERVQPRDSVAQQEVREGPRLWERAPDRCCALRKVEPLDLALEGVDAWVTGLRRSESGSRSDVRDVEWDASRRLLKLNPLSGWSGDDVERYASSRGLPRHPLRDQGYASIGCAPCTRPVRAGEDERAGRWSGTQKTECGLHGPSRQGPSCQGPSRRAPSGAAPSLLTPHLIQTQAFPADAVQP